jgi:hypothetical protein
MKTLKLTILATILAFAMVSVANADGFKTRPAQKVINITLLQAIQNPGLVSAMYQQIDPNSLNTGQETYTFVVVYQGYNYRITGTHDQWMIFFRSIGVSVKDKRVPIGIN